MRGHVYLIGLMGAGKTTIGRNLANFLHLDFIDTDQLLEQRTGVSISHIFEIEGESGFRERESKLLAEISEQPDAVISTGGGIVLMPENRRVMRKHGQVIYLRASINILWKRLKDCHNRPLLQTADPKATIVKLLEERDPIYAEEADTIIEVSSSSANKTAHRISKIIQNNAKTDNNPVKHEPADLK